MIELDKYSRTVLEEFVEKARKQELSCDGNEVNSITKTIIVDVLQSYLDSLPLMVKGL